MEGINEMRSSREGCLNDREGVMRGSTNRRWATTFRVTGGKIEPKGEGEMGTVLVQYAVDQSIKTRYR
jgi:hypothetical protein